MAEEAPRGVQSTIFRIVPSKVFGLPGMVGMDGVDPSELPKPTRWDFDG